MKASFWAPYISDGTIQAICWTLIHSLWIGMIIALVSGLVITFTRKSAAELRYRLLCGVLILFVTAVSVTYFLEARSVAAKPLVINPTKLVFTSPVSPLPAVYTNFSPKVSLLNKTIDFLNQNTGIIFMVWLLFFVMKSLKMVSGLLYIQRIRNYKVHAVSEEFKHKIEVFSRQIGIGQKVRLVQSELVKVPVAIGWLKPMILLPMGIMFQLTTEQLDGILWHELAHIRRRDYLVNILQGLVETVFFFNPGLLWLSSLIRTEREACCDDMVLSRTSHKANYLEALLAFGHGDFKQASLAMSIGSGSQLRTRLKRMINQENKRLSITEKAVLCVGLALLVVFTAVPKINQAAGHFVHAIAKKTIKSIATAPDKPAANKSVLLFKPQQVVKDTTVKKRDTVIYFTSILFKNSDADLANNFISAEDMKGNRYHFTVADGKLTAMDINDAKVADNKLIGYQYMLRNIYRQIDEKRRGRTEDIAAYKANLPNTRAKTNGEPRTGFKKAYMAGDPAVKYSMGEDMRGRIKQDSTEYVADRRRVTNLIADLVAEKVVANAAAVKWFGLSDTEFIVNGQKQTAALQQKLKAKYGVHEGYGLYYGPAKMTGTGVFIDADNAQNAPPRGYFNKSQLRDEQAKIPMQSDKIREGEIKFKRDYLQANNDDQKFKRDSAYWIDRRGMKTPKVSAKASKFDVNGMKQDRRFMPRIPLTPIIADVIRDLVEENILKDESDLASFNLTNSFLTVNGVKQSENIHEKLKNKYLDASQYPLDPQVMNDPHFGLHYDVKGGMGIGISIDKNDP